MTLTRALATPGVRFFRDAKAFRHWLETNHDSTSELWVGFYRKDSGRDGLTYPEAVDQALCFGWIDGVRRKVDEVSYTNRFSPRTKRSIWSAVNRKRFAELSDQGLVADAGRAVFEARDPARAGLYSFEQADVSFPDDLRQLFQTDLAAWAYFERQSPSYRRTIIWWVISAKREDTRRSRLAQLIDASRQQRRVGAPKPKPEPEP